MTARCCGCGRALELGKSVFTRSRCLPFFELAILVGKKKKKRKKPCRPVDVASPWHPLPRCWHASTVAAMRVFIQTRFAATPHLCPLVHARGLHPSPHTTASFTHSIQNATSIQRRANLLRGAPWVVHTDSGTEGVGHRQRVKGVVGRAKKNGARPHPCPGVRLGTAAAQAKACGKSGRSGGRPSCIPSHGPFGEFLSSVESVQLSQFS
jgi:hypothetical protein